MFHPEIHSFQIFSNPFNLPSFNSIFQSSIFQSLIAVSQYTPQLFRPHGPLFIFIHTYIHIFTVFDLPSSHDVSLALFFAATHPSTTTTYTTPLDSISTTGFTTTFSNTATDSTTTPNLTSLPIAPYTSTSCSIHPTTSTPGTFSSATHGSLRHCPTYTTTSASHNSTTTIPSPHTSHIATSISTSTSATIPTSSTTSTTSTTSITTHDKSNPCHTFLFNHHHYTHLMCYKHHHLIQQQSLHSSWPHQPHQLHHHHLTLQQPHQRLLNLLQHPSTHPHSLRHHTTYHALPSQHHPLHPHSALQEVFGATQIAHHHAHLNITAIQPFQPFPPLHHHKLHPDPGAALDHYVPRALHYQDVEAPPPNPWLALKHNPNLQIDKHHNHQQSPKTKLTLPSKTSLPLPLPNTLQSQLTVLPALHSSPTHISLPSIPQNRHFHHHPQHQHLQFQYSVDLTTCLLQHSNHPLIQHNWKSSNGSTATHKHLMSKMNP